MFTERKDGHPIVPGGEPRRVSPPLQGLRPGGRQGAASSPSLVALRGGPRVGSVTGGPEKGRVKGSSKHQPVSLSPCEGRVSVSAW